MPLPKLSADPFIFVPLLLKESMRTGETEMREGETELEIARRHVCEGEAIVSRQIAMIAYLTSCNLPTDQAEKVLLHFERMLILFHNRLYRLEVANLALTPCASLPPSHL